MRSFFFIPGNKLYTLPKVRSYGPDELIIDLEDAVKGSERDNILQDVNAIPVLKNVWMRLPIRNSFEEAVDTTFVQKFLEKGYRRLILPKLASKAELASLSNLFASHKELELILLVEHPRLLLEVEEILRSETYPIVGIGLGSHDLMAFMNMKHTLLALDFPRQKLLYAARAYKLLAIDIASMELKDTDRFEEELKDGFDKGFDGKFIIHPWQLDLLKNYNPFDAQDYQWAQQVLDAFEKSGSLDEFAPVVLHGVVIERPHIRKAMMIMNKIKQNESK